MFMSNSIDAIISNHHLLIERCADCTRCFYQLGNEEVGAVLIKGIGAVYSYRTDNVPNTVIAQAMIDRCMDRVSKIR